MPRTVSQCSVANCGCTEIDLKLVEFAGDHVNARIRQVSTPCEIPGFDNAPMYALISKLCSTAGTETTP